MNLLQRADAPQTPDVSLSERLAFERLLADLSMKFANLPGARVIEELERALARLIEFLGFDRSSYAELPARSSLKYQGSGGAGPRGTASRPSWATEHRISNLPPWAGSSA